MGSRILAALTASMLVVAGASLASAETFYTDQGHTEVRFAWSHAGVSIQTGEFTEAKGVLNLDRANLENSTLEATINAASVSTGVEKLDAHLKNKDFLEVETYPEITFKSTAVKVTGDKTADVTGDLTLHGVTKPVVLKAELTFDGAHPVGSRIDYYKGKWVAFAATMTIDHHAFGVGSFSTGPIAITISTEMKDRPD